MSNEYLLLIILGMFIVTYPVRFIPMVFFNRIGLPSIFKTWLSYMPVAIFAALLTQIFYNQSTGQFEIDKQFALLTSCLATIVLTYKTKSIGWGLGFGFGFYLLVTYLALNVF